MNILEGAVGLDAAIALVIHLQRSQSVWMGQAKAYRQGCHSAIEGKAHYILCA